MFYSIPLTLQPEYRGVTAELVIDLPQRTEDEARRNPFVHDLLGHPFVHAHLDREAGDNSPDTDYLNRYNGDPHAYRCQEVRIVYQNWNIEPLHAGHREFVFHIYACVSEAVAFPEPELCFTVTERYGNYIDLFGRDQLVIDHVPVYQPPFHLHNYVCVRTGVATVELGTINCVNDEHGLQRLVLSDVNQTEIEMTNANKAMIHPIRLTDELLETMGFVMTNSAIYRYPMQDHFDKPIIVNGIHYLLCLIRDGRYSYQLIVEDGRAAYGTMAYQVDYLNELQVQIMACYQYDFLPHPELLKNYLQRKMNNHYFAANYRSLICEYYNNLGYAIPARVMFIQDIAAHYRVDQDIVQVYVDEMILSGEIVVR